jgi:SRSO17 transposase
MDVMDRRFEWRFDEMMEQAEVPSELLKDLLPRVRRFLQPFLQSLSGPSLVQRATEYTTGLMSGLEHKTGEGIAYLYDQDRQRMQKFIGQTFWDHQPLVRTLAAQVGAELGESDGVIVFDPSAFPKKGDKSVGVAKQWCGRLGKVENCQVAVYMGYVTPKEHAIVNTRLYLTNEWANNRRRRKQAGVPHWVEFRTRHQLALEMLEECGEVLPHTWIAGDDEMGRPASFRLKLRSLGKRYLLAVPSNTLIRDIEAPPPEYSGRGPRPRSPFTRVDAWRKTLAEDAWTTIDVRDGEKGPLVIEAVKHRVRAQLETGGTGPEEMLFVTRERQADNTYKLDYYLSDASGDVPLEEFARVAKASHRIEECIKRAKGEAGLADYQVRNWIGWHHHQILSLLAAWFLNKETRRGKNADSRAYATATAALDRRADRLLPGDQSERLALPPEHAVATAQRASTLLPLSFT